MFEYVLKNKEWIFSGLGVSILVGLIPFIRFLSKKYKQIQKSKKSSESLPAIVEGSVSSRFIKLFEAHGVHRNQIPRMFGHNLTLIDVESEKALLSKLDDEAINNACALFNVKKNWLDGASRKIYPTYDFYKEPDQFVLFIENLLSKVRYGISGVLLSPPQKENFREAILLLEVTIGYIEDEPYFQYYLLNNWSISYWKSRAYLTSCIAHCLARKVYIYGLIIPGTFIETISEGEKLLSFGNDGISFLNGKKWHPEDMTILPEKYLDGIDPEYGNFGIRAGLEKWLELESKGHMRSGLEDKETKHKFETEYKKYL